MQHGVLPGGGVALYQASKLLESGLPEIVLDKYESIGVKILGEALKKPMKILIENKTGQSSAGIIQKIEEDGDLFTGYDVREEKLVDMVDEGIVDSYKVVRTYL